MKRIVAFVFVLALALPSVASADSFSATLCRDRIWWEAQLQRQRLGVQRVGWRRSSGTVRRRRLHVVLSPARQPTQSRRKTSSSHVPDAHHCVRCASKSRICGTRILPALRRTSTGCRPSAGDLERDLRQEDFRVDWRRYSQSSGDAASFANQFLADMRSATPVHEQRVFLNSTCYQARSGSGDSSSAGARQRCCSSAQAQWPWRPAAGCAAPARQSLGYPSSTLRARASRLSSARSTSVRARSIRSSPPSPGTSIGSPSTTATVLNGFGICALSQLFVVQKRSASR